MARLEELTPGARVHGILAAQPVRVVQVEWHGSNSLTLTFRTDDGRPDHDLLYRDDESRLHVDGSEAPAWSLDADGELFRLVSEAKRISLAYLFDPFLAVQTSNLDPLPHQIEAVYNNMLDRQPLRFLLADDPGAGKTIMAGLFIKELMVRGDVERCLVVAPGSLVEQWQDELRDKLHLEFRILTRDMIEASVTGNPFTEFPFLIARLDHLSRNEELQAKLGASDWDLVIADEAHKMSAHYYGNEVKETKRYRLGRLLGSVTRHLLLMTATPHSGKPDDFELFLALLDSDRFEGKVRDGTRTFDTSDMMRRVVKEDLLKFDGTKLFPERRAYTIHYELSDAETSLYQQVTDYVTEEMNRAERLKAEGDGRRGAVVGFALTTLQRRLASSPEAIYRSLERRRKRLQRRVAEEEIRKRAGEISAELGTPEIPDEFRDADDDFDADDLPDTEFEELEEELVDQASAARTIVELEAEIARLEQLEQVAHRLRLSNEDVKWEQLQGLLHDTPEMFHPDGSRRKLIVFTEHRDTLNYLVEKLRGFIGRSEAVVTIHGGMSREHRRKAQEAFTEHKDVLILVATDAAGEGINLQRAHLMVNYDLPWNPNRLEQRFGRVHRIGQEEVCHLWNLVAKGTREGAVFTRLFEKLDEQRAALGGQVFDVLGEAFADRSLRDLLVEAIRYGEEPERRLRLGLVVDHTVGERLRELVHKRGLAADVMREADVERVREQMERAEARKLQPHFIRRFFLEAFTRLGGTIKEREPGRFEITRVPSELRRRDRQVGVGKPLVDKYERITFERDLITKTGRPPATFCCPGHPLLDVTLDVVTERFGALLKQGTVLVDGSDAGETPYVLVYLEHGIQDGRTDRSGNRRVVSKRFEFVQVDPDGTASDAGWAPYVDMRAATDDERTLLADVIEAPWVRKDLDDRALEYAIDTLSREHLDDVRRRTFDRVDRTTEAVKARLHSEITYWDDRAQKLKDRELAGKLPRSGMNSAKARQRANELHARLRRREAELHAERQVSPLPPVIVGGALVIPAGLLERARGERTIAPESFARETERVERVAVDAVLAAERILGRAAVEMARNHKGYDIESKAPDGTMYFIEVKGRIEGAETVTVTTSEIGVGRNKPDQFILALVEVPTDDGDPSVHYLRHPFADMRDPHFAEVSSNFELKKLLVDATVPA